MIIILNMFHLFRLFLNTTLLALDLSLSSVLYTPVVKYNPKVSNNARSDFWIRILLLQIPIQMDILELFSVTTYPIQSKDWD
jgi:hypothetical protein